MLETEFHNHLSGGAVEGIPLRKVGTALPLELMSPASIVTLALLTQRDAVFVSCLPGTSCQES